MAKVAVLSETDFHDLNRPAASAVSVWARFAQPSRLVWAADDAARAMAARAISGAAPTLLNAALAFTEREVDVLDLWQSGFRMTYDAELRAERNDRPASVVEFDPERYERFGQAALQHTPIANEYARRQSPHPCPTRKAGSCRNATAGPHCRRGKLLTVARLAKRRSLMQAASIIWRGR